ncbi:hypothetical protein BRADI_1g59961v3 [Brachypodium distachyon]|uniref:Secreted protein n=1 Tax=Brachypodium distachyon TaxID=15368 RepID=A0A2K2DSI9_BRADI|nr:hypothetical protein BRADI_1g59961v3 [Brachypodium distachyon]
MVGRWAIQVLALVQLLVLLRLCCCSFAGCRGYICFVMALRAKALPDLLRCRRRRRSQASFPPWWWRRGASTNLHPLWSNPEAILPFTRVRSLYLLC